MTTLKAWAWPIAIWTALILSFGVIQAAASSAATQPAGSSTIGTPDGHCLQDLGSTVGSRKCDPTVPAQWWLAPSAVQNNTGTISAFGSPAQQITVTSAGTLAITPSGNTWVYGPGHTLSTQISGKTKLLTWKPRPPHVARKGGTSQLTYVLTKGPLAHANV